MKRIAVLLHMVDHSASAFASFLAVILAVLLLVGCQESPIGPDEADLTNAQTLQENGAAKSNYDWIEYPTFIYLLDIWKKIPYKLIPLPPSQFDFSNGSEQGWTLMQLYDSDGQPEPSNQVSSLLPVVPVAHTMTPFALGTMMPGWLAAETLFIFPTDPQADRVDIYLQSPDLTRSWAWQNANGYELDVQRTINSLCASPEDYLAQLQVVMVENATGQTSVHAQLVAGGGAHHFYPVSLNTTHSLTMQIPILSDPNYTLLHLRVRLTMKGTGKSVECASSGAWMIRDVQPR